MILIFSEENDEINSAAREFHHFLSMPLAEGVGKIHGRDNSSFRQMSLLILLIFYYEI